MSASGRHCVPLRPQTFCRRADIFGHVWQTILGISSMSANWSCSHNVCSRHSQLRIWRFSMVGVVNCQPRYEYLVSCQTLPNRSCQEPYQAVRVSGIAGSNQILPCQPWFWAGRFCHGGGGCQGRRRPSTIVVLCTKVPIPTYIR